MAFKKLMVKKNMELQREALAAEEERIAAIKEEEAIRKKEFEI